MKTKIEKEGDTVLVSMGGRIEHEIHEPFKENLRQLIRDQRTDCTPKNIIFDLKELEFVGSSGISKFVQTLKDFSTQSHRKPRYCNVRNEFKKIFKALDEENHFEFFDNREQAKRSFDH